MHIKDGGEQSSAIKVRSVRALDDYKLWVRFTTNEEKVFDFAPLLDFPCYKPLKDKELFNGVYVDFGAAVWSDGEIDIAPESLYERGISAKGGAIA